MKLLIRFLVVIALATGGHVAYAQLRPEVGKPLQQASDYLKAGRAKEALAKVREADAVANKTPAEQLTIDRMRGAAAARAGEPQTAIKSFEAAMASGKLSPAEQAQTAEQLAHLYSQVKDWNKTREWAQKAKQLGGNAADLDKLLAYVNSQSGDFGAIARDAQAGHRGGGESRGAVPKRRISCDCRTRCAGRATMPGSPPCSKSSSAIIRSRNTGRSCSAASRASPASLGD